MSAENETPQAPRPTPTQAYRELAMAYATKQAQRGSDSTEYGTVGTSGDRFGLAYLKSLHVVRDEDETADEYRARKHRAIRDELEFLAKLNADKLRRDLEASVKS